MADQRCSSGGVAAVIVPCLDARHLAPHLGNQRSIHRRQQGVPEVDAGPQLLQQVGHQRLADPTQIPVRLCQEAFPTRQVPVDEHARACDIGHAFPCRAEHGQGPDIAAEVGEVLGRKVLAKAFQQEHHGGGKVGIHRTPPFDSSRGGGISHFPVSFQPNIVCPRPQPSKMRKYS